MSLDREMETSAVAIPWWELLGTGGKDDDDEKLEGRTYPGNYSVKSLIRS